MFNFVVNSSENPKPQTHDGRALMNHEVHSIMTNWGLSAPRTMWPPGGIFALRANANLTARGAKHFLPQIDFPAAATNESAFMIITLLPFSRLINFWTFP